jgi:hypothetical protein
MFSYLHDDIITHILDYIPMKKHHGSYSRLLILDKYKNIEDMLHFRQHHFACHTFLNDITIHQQVRKNNKGIQKGLIYYYEKVTFDINITFTDKKNQTIYLSLQLYHYNAKYEANECFYYERIYPLTYTDTLCDEDWYH